MYQRVINVGSWAVVKHHVCRFILSTVNRSLKLSSNKHWWRGCVLQSVLTLSSWKIVLLIQRQWRFVSHYVWSVHLGLNTASPTINFWSNLLGCDRFSLCYRFRQFRLSLNNALSSRCDTYSVRQVSTNLRIFIDGALRQFTLLMVNFDLACLREWIIHKCMLLLLLFIHWFLAWIIWYGLLMKTYSTFLAQLIPCYICQHCLSLRLVRFSLHTLRFTCAFSPWCTYLLSTSAVYIHLLPIYYLHLSQIFSFILHTYCSPLLW